MKIPLATYRLQFQPEFGFDSAVDIVDYLYELGISDIYASPVFAARKGSRHGYDCVDPNALNTELGSQQSWDRLAARLKALNMGWLQDIVPNHMAFHAGNRMLADVLENGPVSVFHDFFDICWSHASRNLQGKLMAPFLGDRYSRCLKSGQIRLVYEEDGFAVAYGDLKFPLRAETWLLLLDRKPRIVEQRLGTEDPARLLWVDTLDLLESLAVQVDPAARNDHIRAVKQNLWGLYRDQAVVREYIDESLTVFNGNPGDIDSYQALDRLLSRQLFRLCFWKTANEEINYRRFFDINELIALRQEDQAVFDHTHQLLLRLAAQKVVTGVRIDHVDGLADPGQYLRRLRRRTGEETYMLVEKILAPEEHLPSDWPVQGTTGYDFAYRLNALFVDHTHAASFSRIYARFSGLNDPFEEIVVNAKKDILTLRLNGDLDNLARRFKAVSALMRFADTMTLNRLKAALSQVLAVLPVYRTYIDGDRIREADRNIIRTVVAAAIERQPDLRFELDFIRNQLLEKLPAESREEDLELNEQRLQAVRAFQQLSAALMAKGFEDTAFYRYHRLISLNEVGGEPGRFGCSVRQFHDFIRHRAGHQPHAMNSTATHDAKRGEDVRARLNVLSEIPEEWEYRLEAWHTFCRDRCVPSDRGSVPDRNTEYLLYQTLIGTWPRGRPATTDFFERIKAFMIKAAREAGQYTSWIDPQQDYEQALAAFVDNLLDPAVQNGFMPAFVPFCQKIAFFGLFNSLSQCLLKITLPGVPDFFQGSELPQLVLVDPDNRQPISYEERKQALQTIRSNSPDPLKQIAALLEARDDGKIKLFVIARALEARRQWPALFQQGRYLPLEASGRRQRNIVAFAREAGGRWCVCVVPRFVTALVNEDRDPVGPAVWDDTALHLPRGAPQSWRNLFTQQTINGREKIAAADALRQFPVALLVGESVP
jgi:(1->4)-alpha-D-glucan 1-alpha-D-glucosylmutase